MEAGVEPGGGGELRALASLFCVSPDKSGARMRVVSGSWGSAGRLGRPLRQRSVAPSDVADVWVLALAKHGSFHKNARDLVEKESGEWLVP